MPGQKLSFPGRNYLFTPGPTHIPNVVQNAMNVPMEDHRAPDFPELVKPILRDLKKVFLTNELVPIDTLSQRIILHSSITFTSIEQSITHSKFPLTSTLDPNN